MTSQLSPGLSGKAKPYLMAHRGNRVSCPENTLAAFRRALDEGADILETDLHLTADGAFVCIHDATVDRTTDGHGPVSEMTLDALRALHAHCGRPEFSEERIPALSELCAILPADAALALELKTDRFLEPEICHRLAAELTELNARDRVIALSFSLPRLQAIQAAAPDIPVGWITLSRLWPMQGVQMLGPTWPLLMINPFYVAAAHKNQQLICPLDPVPDSRLWFYKWLGCDAVLTDDPGATRAALGRLSSGGR